PRIVSLVRHDDALPRAFQQRQVPQLDGPGIEVEGESEWTRVRCGSVRQQLDAPLHQGGAEVEGGDVELAERPAQEAPAGELAPDRAVAGAPEHLVDLEAERPVVEGDGDAGKAELALGARERARVAADRLGAVQDADRAHAGA